MLDIKLLRDDCDSVAKRLFELRGFTLDVNLFHDLEERRKTLQVETQSLQHERNARSKEIGQAKARGDDVKPLFQAVATLGDKLNSLKEALNIVLSDLDDMLLAIPNLPHETVPLGTSEDENQEVKTWGKKAQFSFSPRSHDELGEHLGLMDFSLSAKITGSRFVVMKGALAQLHRALTQFMLDVHVKNGYEEVYVPFIVNKESLIGTGQLPKFEEDLFKIDSTHGYYLTSTGEVPLVNTVRDRIFSEKELPLKLVCHTPCFRQEAGTYGKDTKGMIRQHQFEKVELVWVTDPSTSYDAHEQLTSHAESILQLLELPYRKVSLCGGDIGFTAAKTYDLEVWLPSQDTYREISSCSNCEAFQSRRMKTRIKNGKDMIMAHTLNGSGLAVGRTLVAVLENYQTEQGQITVPKVLQPYMQNKTLIA